MERIVRHFLQIAIVGSFFIGNKALAIVASDFLIVKDLPFIRDSADLGSYISGLFQLGIGIAVTLAVVMLVINGIQYMFSDIPGIKAAAKNNLGNIIWGLLLAFSSWLILYTINPNLIKLELVTALEEAVEIARHDIPPAPPDNPGAAWPDDSSVRSRLQAAGIPVNNANCTTVGQKGCTSVYNLSQTAIEGLINLKARCNCDVTVTGGTEYWLHRTHGNNRTVDLRNSASLRTYIGGAGTRCFEPKVKDGLTFHWESTVCGPQVAPHWHITF